MTDRAKARAGCCGDAQSDKKRSDKSQSELMALQLKALGHPMRLQILDCLTRKPDCCCGEVCAELPLAQSTVSQHLDLLCRSGLVEVRPDGNRSNYRLNREALHQVGRNLTLLAEASGSHLSKKAGHG